MRFFLLRVGFALACIASLVPARAQTLAFTVPAGGHDNNAGLDSFGGSLGLSFSISGPLPFTVRSLGYWDDERNGLGAGITIHVAIFDRNASGGPAIVPGAEMTFTGQLGTLVGNIVDDQLLSTPPGDPVQDSGRAGQFRLANLDSPVSLPTGNYALVAWGYGGANEYLNGANTNADVVEINSFDGILTFDHSAFGNPPGVFPTTDDSSFARYVSATFSPDAIPEPANVALAFAAIALIGAVIARRKRKSA